MKQFFKTLFSGSHYNTFNVLVFNLTAILLVVLITLDFDSLLATLVQVVAIILCGLIFKYTGYDMGRFLDTHFKSKIDKDNF